MVPDVSGVLEDCIEVIECKEIKQFYKQNTESLVECYEIANDNNLRSIKQVLYDFEMLSSCLSKEVKEKI